VGFNHINQFAPAKVMIGKEHKKSKKFND